MTKITCICAGSEVFAKNLMDIDPLTAAERTLDQSWSMLDEQIEAHGDCLPAYQ